MSEVDVKSSLSGEHVPLLEELSSILHLRIGLNRPSVFLVGQ